MIYFIQSGRGGPVKIGSASNVSKRLKEMQVGNPCPLRLLGVMDLNHSTESELHDMFKGIRVRGEWYWPTLGLLEFIARECFEGGEAIALLLNVWTGNL